MIETDDRYWPLVIFRFAGDVSMPELEDYLRRQDEMLSRHQPTASLVLTEDLRLWEMPVMRRQAAWIKQHQATLRKYSLGAALVITTPFVRGMLKALLWMQPMPQPYVVVATQQEGLAWLRERFRLAKVELPAQLPAAL